MSQEPIKVGLTRFSDFVVSDPNGQAAKIREIVRQMEAPYLPGADFWSRWRDEVTDLHRRELGPRSMRSIGAAAPESRQPQYSSASAGYEAFWGRKQIVLDAELESKPWTCGRLTIGVNPEWVLLIDGVPTIVKLHLKQKLALTQRLANPILFLLQDYAENMPVERFGVLDVHRSKIFFPTRALAKQEAVLRMQAAAFVAGWDAIVDSSAA